jgi:hypothetical protein
MAFPLEELVRATETAAGSLGFRYVPTGGALIYDDRMDALRGDPRVVLDLVRSREEKLGIPLDEAERLREVEAYAYHETMHGVIWRRLGPLTPDRYVPEEYWIMRIVNGRYGSARFDGLIFDDYYCRETEPWKEIVEGVHRHGLVCDIVPAFSRALFFHTKEELASVFGFLSDLKQACESVRNYDDLHVAQHEVKRILELNDVLIVEEVCD